MKAINWIGIRCNSGNFSEWTCSVDRHCSVLDVMNIVDYSSSFDRCNGVLDVVLTG